jgi:hypothetical protein
VTVVLRRSAPVLAVADALVPGLGLTNARVVQQSPGIGRSIRLVSIDGTLWGSYGDYGANEGPIYPQRLTAGLGSWVEDNFAMQTEESLPPIELADGRLIVGHKDPRGATSYGYSERPALGVWSSQEFAGAVGTPVHVFHMLEHADRLWACGSRDAATPATVWMSDDGGDTWSVSLSGDSTDGGSRFYAMAAVGDALYTQEAAADPLHKWTAAEGWEDVAGAIVLNNGAGDPGFAWRDGWVTIGDLSSWALYFDGTTTTNLAANGFSCAAVGPDGRLNVLLSTGRGSYRLATYETTGPLTPTLQPFTFRLRGTEYPTSLVVTDDGTLVIGTNQARIYMLGAP